MVNGDCDSYMVEELHEGNSIEPRQQNNQIHDLQHNILQVPIFTSTYLNYSNVIIFASVGQRATNCIVCSYCTYKDFDGSCHLRPACGGRRDWTAMGGASKVSYSVL